MMEEDDGSESAGRVRVERFFHTLLTIVLTAGACCLLGWVLSVTGRDDLRMERVMSMPFMDKAEVLEAKQSFGGPDGLDVELWLKYADSSTVDGLTESLFWIETSPYRDGEVCPPDDYRRAVDLFMERFPQADRSGLKLLWCPAGAYMMKRGSVDGQNFSHVYGVYDPSKHVLLLDICIQ